MKEKRCTSYMLIGVICLFFFFSGCSKDTSILPSESSITTFTALLTDNNAKVKWGEDAVSAEITRRTGVKLDLEILTGDLSTRTSTMLASGTYPDLILSIDNDTLARLVEMDALYPLDSYIEKYGQNIPKIFGKDLNMMRNETDGMIYGLNRDYKAVSARSNSLFHVQYDMLLDAGCPQVKTLDDLFVLMKNYKDRNPAFNGYETIGLTGWGDSWGMNITFNNPALCAAGYQNDGNYVVMDNLDVKYGLTLPSTKEYFKWLNKLYTNGLFDADALVQKRDKFVEKVSSGRVLVATSEYWDMGDSEAALRKAGLDDRCYAQLPIVLSNNISSHISNYDPYGTWKSVITKSCKDPEAAFRFFDRMWAEDMQILCNWGVEGLHYDVINGKRVLKQEVLELVSKDPDWKSKTGILLYGMWSYGENVKGTDGQTIVPFGTPEQLYEKQDAITKKVLTAYKATTWRDLCAPPKPSKYSFAWKLTLPQNSVGAYAENRVNNEIRRKYLPKIILANNDAEFEKEWDEFVNVVNEMGIGQRELEIKNALSKQISH